MQETTEEAFERAKREAGIILWSEYCGLKGKCEDLEEKIIELKNALVNVVECLDKYGYMHNSGDAYKQAKAIIDKEPTK